MATGSPVSGKGSKAAGGSSSEQNKMVVGVDFGTTFTGVSYGLTAKPDEIFTITDWPGMNNRSFEKVPTEISYNLVPEGGSKTFSWGFKAAKDSERLKWFKLLLNPSGQSSDVNNVVAAKTKSMPKNLSPVDVVKDFISGVMEHLEAEIMRKYGVSFFGTMPKRYIFTVPALWSDNAKALTHRAIHLAGFVKVGDEVCLVPEPEAAALCCLRQIQACTVKENDTIIVADCGGGTADVISYTLKSLSPMRVVEAAPGEGDLCGSVYVDISFETMLKARFGDEIFNALTAKQKQALMKGFEQEIKCIFANDPSEESFSFGVPGMEKIDSDLVDGGYLELSREEVVAIFAPVLRRVTKLIKSQKAKIEDRGGSVAALLLVGGFGGSAYLLEHFKEFSKKNGGFHVLQPPNGWGAIGKGAVIHGFENGSSMVTSRISRRYYGIRISVPFIKGVDDIKHKYFDAKKDQFYCDNIMRWFIRKGDEINDSQPVTHTFTHNIWIADFSDTEKNFYLNLLAYDGDGPPPKYSTDPNIKTIGRMHTDLSLAPDHCWKRENCGTQEDIMTLSFGLSMTLRSGLLNFEMRCGGLSYGNTKIAFDEGL